MPVDTAIVCKNKKTGKVTIGGLPLFDSIAGRKDPHIDGFTGKGD
jgi:hypothetical protein